MTSNRLDFLVIKGAIMPHDDVFNCTANTLSSFTLVNAQYHFTEPTPLYMLTEVRSDGIDSELRLGCVDAKRAKPPRPAHRDNHAPVL
jgi:hypothetical protein